MFRRDFLKTATAVAASPLAAAQAGPGEAGPRERLFDDGWRFHRGEADGAERPEFDDSKWRTLDVPHDWSIEDLPPHPESTGEAAIWADANCPARVGPFDRDLSEGKRDTGWVVGGTGWYRKRFPGAASSAARHAEIRFDGVYMNSDVWLNGQHLGNHPYGYTSFAYDLTPHLRADSDNVVAVRVRNEGRNSRWYSGSGIYRHVWLTVTGEVRVPLWGVCVTTPEVSADQALVRVSVGIENRASGPHQVTVRVKLRDATGAVVASHEHSSALAASSASATDHAMTVTRPRLWSLAAPQLYRAEVELETGGALADRVATNFGIRRIEVDSERGLRINGERVKLKGGCLHHDNGLLGAAAIDRAEERRVELMKANGFNAIRCSHNPPSPAFLDACDRLGMLVIDEAFDCWEIAKNPQDYHLYFKDWWKRDVDSMVLRDRNHPCVIFWSIGNEIPERAEPRGVASAKMLVEEIKRLDTRPVTAAIPFFWESGKAHAWTEADPAFQQVDVGGYNYQWQEYERDHERLPHRIMMGTESFPIQAFENWELVEKHPYVLGDFVWTGMDYLGESGIGNSQLSAPKMPWEAPAAKPAAGDDFGAGLAQIFAPYPWFNAYCGDIDLIGERKPQGSYRAVVWGTSPLELAVQRPVPEGRKELISPWGWSDELPSWTWPGYEGRPLTVRVYSRGEQVRLLLNGNEVGVKAISAQTKLRAEFEVPYTAGELRAVALAQGRTIAELALKTVARPAKLRLRADRTAIRPERWDLAFVTVEVLDAAGNLVPDAVVPVTFTLTGAAELAGTGNANPKDPRSFRRPHVRTYHGRCLAVVRPVGTAGTVELRVTADGLTGASVTIRVG